MCGSNALAPANWALRPEMRLAMLLAEELQVHVEPSALRVFLRAHWSTVAPLAHKIHGKEMPDG